MTDRAAGVSSAAPIPWPALAAISAPTLEARPLASEAVVNTVRPVRKTRRPPAEQHQASARQDIGGDDPLQSPSGEAERSGDGWQRHVHDGGVEDDHELGHAEQDQQRPWPAFVVWPVALRRSSIGVSDGGWPGAMKATHSV